MRLCQVLGSVVATVKHPTYVGHKLMVVQPLDERGQAQGASFLAVDRVDAGAGDVVLVNSEGGGARLLFGGDKLPIRSVIVGVVDHVHVSATAAAGKP